jgi:hypothetical protein
MYNSIFWVLAVLCRGKKLEANKPYWNKGLHNVEQKCVLNFRLACALNLVKPKATS